MSENMFLSGIFIYPVKGLKGISLAESAIDPMGLKNDRRWMLVDENNRFLSQRELPVLSQFSIEQTPSGYKVRSPERESSIDLKIIRGESPLNVNIWDDTLPAEFSDNITNEWFRDILKIKCSLVYLPENSKRNVDSNYNTGNDTVSFADAFPVLIIGQASLEYLNQKLEQEVNMDRFRPNLVFTGGMAFEEDNFKEFKIGVNSFYAAKPCARCTVVTINQQTGVSGKEPLNTLAQFRTFNNKVHFGQNLLIKEARGPLKLGDKLSPA